MPNILLKEMKSEYNGEKVGYFFFKDDPKVMLYPSYNCQLFLR
jgi:hypothetical protein